MLALTWLRLPQMLKIVADLMQTGRNAKICASSWSMFLA